MGVLLGGATMRGPACMTHAKGSVQRSETQCLLQIAQLTGAAYHLQPLVVDYRQSRRVVSPVLEPAQPVHEDAGEALIADVSNDAAHGGNEYRGFRGVLQESRMPANRARFQRRFFLRRLTQLSTTTCRPRAIAKLYAGTSLVMGARA